MHAACLARKLNAIKRKRRPPKHITPLDDDMDEPVHAEEHGVGPRDTTPGG